MRHRRAGCVPAVLMAGLTAGCAAAPQPPADRVTAQADARSQGWPAGSRFVLALSTPFDASAKAGYLAFVDGAGETTYMRTGSQESARLAVGRDVLCTSSGATSYRFTRGSMQTARGSGGRGAGQAALVDVDGRCVSVFNSGLTDVFWGPGAHLRRAEVPTSPNAVGLGDGAVWVSNIADSSTTGGRATAYRVDLRSGDVSRRFEWRTWRGTSAMRERGQVTSDVAGEGMYEHRNQLYFLEEDRLMPRGSDRVIPVAPGKPGKKAQLRLGSLDLSTGSYRSSYLRNVSEGMFDRQDGSVSGAAAACYKTHRVGTSVYTCDADGDIIRVSLESRSATVVGRLSDAAQHTPDAVVAFSVSAMTMFLIDSNTGRTIAETYDLSTGKRTNATELRGIARLLKNGRLTASDAAALGP